MNTVIETINGTSIEIRCIGFGSSVNRHFRFKINEDIELMSTCLNPVISDSNGNNTVILTLSDKLPASTLILQLENSEYRKLLDYFKSFN